MAVPVVQSELEYFSPEYLQSSIVKHFDTEYRPLSAMQHGAPIVFNVPRIQGLFIDGNGTLLQTKVKMTKADGTAVVAETVGPCNLLHSSLWKNVEVQANERVLSDANNLNAYRGYVETLLSFSPEVCESQLITELWHKDTPTKFEDMVAAAAGANLGFKERTKELGIGSTWTTGRLHADIFQMGLYLPDNINLRITLYPSRDEFVLGKAAGDGENYRIVVEEAILRVKYAQMSPSYLVGLGRAARHRNVRLPMRRVQIKQFSIAVGATAEHRENIWLGRIPDRCVFGMVEEQAMSGSYTRNPFNFQHFGHNFLQMQVNGENVPSIAFQPNFAAENDRHALLEYLSLFEGQDIMYTQRGLPFKPDEFKGGYGLVIFNFKPDRAASKAKSAPRSGQVSLDLRFSAPTAATVAVLLLAEFDTTVEIDFMGNIVSAF